MGRRRDPGSRSRGCERASGGRPDAAARGRGYRAGEGFCTVELPFSDGVTQQERYFHGAVIGAVGDNAGRHAALTLAPPDREVLTVEYKVNFLARPAARGSWPEARSSRPGGGSLSAGARVSRSPGGGGGATRR